MLYWTCVRDNTSDSGFMYYSLTLPLIHETDSNGT